MNIKDWRDRAFPGGGKAVPIAKQEASPPTRVDEETGEILEALGPTDEAPDGLPPASDDSAKTVRGERTIPSVNRERSVQSRVRSALAVGTVAVLGLAFLWWYYAGQFARASDAKAAQQKAAESRTAGENRLPPLGRIDPPNLVAKAKATSNDDLLGPAPPLPATPAAYGPPAATTSAPPPKTPQQIELERKLGQPVLLHSTPPAPTTALPVVAGSPSAGDAAPSLAALLAGIPMPQGADASTQSAVPAATALSGLLRPTPVPSVSAQVLPTQRLLLPKGAFIDCTLETAIDSTFDGMVTCIGATDVYGADGKVVLFDRGTKYFGEKRGDVRQGQGRVFVVWSEARTPTGVVVNLMSPGTDELGRTGLPGYVNTHFWERFGAAILVSVIDGTLQAMAAGGGNGTSVNVNPQGSRDVMTEVLKTTIAIPPTIVKNQGDRVQILIARDVDFRSVYALRTDPRDR